MVTHSITTILPAAKASRLPVWFWLLLAALLLLAGRPALAQSPTERVLVVFKPGAAAMVQRQARPAELRVIHQFRRLPGMAVEVTAAGLESLRRDPNVLAVAEDLPVQAAESPNLTFLKIEAVQQAFGLTGAGVNVAVLDSGIDVTHPALAGSIVTQQCFNKNATCPGEVAQGDSAQDENGHGTHVAGIVHSVAPGAGLVAVRVLNASGNGYTSDVLAGFDWVLANQPQLNVKVINLSLGGGSYPGACDETDANTLLYSAAINAARQAGISVFAASGNSGKAEEMILPACVAGAVAVGNVYHASLGSVSWPTCTDAAAQPYQVACASNSSSALDVLAPGTQINSAWLGGGERVESGTSMASPHAAGMAALLLQADPTLSPTGIESILKETGAPVTDPRQGRQTPAINALAAVSAAVGGVPVSGAVLLQGRSDHSGSQILLSDQPCAAAEFAGAAAITTAAGQFELLLPASVRCLRAVQPGYLAAQVANPAGNLGSVTLLAGDLNGDQQVNILDLARAAGSFDTSDSAADLDVSGMVDILDLVLIAQNFKLTGPTAWPINPLAESVIQ